MKSFLSHTLLLCGAAEAAGGGAKSQKSKKKRVQKTEMINQNYPNAKKNRLFDT
jgi:hypothetical protein